MRNVYLTLSAPGATPWVPIDWEEISFVVGVAVIPSEDAATVSYTVQYTYDPLGIDYAVPVALARAAGVVTATTPFAHGLTTGDSVNIWSSGSSQMDSQPSAPQPGLPWTSGGNQVVAWTVASTPSPTSFTYAVTNAGPVADNGSAKVQILRVFSHTAMTAKSTRLDDSFTAPVTAARLVLATLTAGLVQLAIVQGMSR